MAVRLEDCIACRLCELRCPDLAIEVEVEPEARDQGPATRNQKPGTEDAA